MGAAAAVVAQIVEALEGVGLRLVAELSVIAVAEGGVVQRRGAAVSGDGARTAAGAAPAAGAGGVTVVQVLCHGEGGRRLSHGRCQCCGGPDCGVGRGGAPGVIQRLQGGEALLCDGVQQALDEVLKFRAGLRRSDSVESGAVGG